MEPCTFRDKRILITGAAGGLGVGLTLKLADMGARLILTARSETALSELQGRLGKGGETVALTADLSRPGEAADLARRAEAAFDGVDVLFNNAGVGYFALMEEATEENIRYLLELNVLSPIRLIQSLLPGMKRRGGGRIVNIVSAGAKRRSPAPASTAAPRRPCRPWPTPCGWSWNRPASTWSTSTPAPSTPPSRKTPSGKTSGRGCAPLTVAARPGAIWRGKSWMPQPGRPGRCGWSARASSIRWPPCSFPGWWTGGWPASGTRP